MSVIRRAVGKPMNLRLSLGANETTKFVRAFLFSSGLPLSPAFQDLTHLGLGIYGNDSRLMPNFDEIDVKFKVYLDAGFTVEDPTYFSSLDTYEKEVFDSTNFLPPFPQQVFAKFENGQLATRIERPPKIRERFSGGSLFALVGAKPSVCVKVQQNAFVVGVFNDDDE